MLRNLNVLLVDDEPIIADLYRMGLPRLFGGHKSLEKADLENDLFGIDSDPDPVISVTVCRQGDEAVTATERAVSDGDPFDVVVLDIRMPPGIDGVQAAERIRKIDTSVPIIFVSGYSDYSMAELRDRVPPEKLMSFIEKPLRLEILAERIRDIVSR